MMKKLPGDPVLMLGVVNTKLRDFYRDLDDLCDDMQVDKAEITKALPDEQIDLLIAVAKVFRK